MKFPFFSEGSVLRKRGIPILLLEVLALILVSIQEIGAVRTDEAKYLLNIPYPHPPLARWILGLTVRLPAQEVFWRVVFATLVIQAAWFVWHMGRNLELRSRFFVAASWVLSAAVLTQAGTIMMAPLTAVQGLVFLWWMSVENDDATMKAYVSSLTKSRWSFVLEKEWRAMIVGLLWLTALFTAYQAVVFLPVVVALLWRTKVPVWQRVLYAFGPLAALAVYTMGNPLILAGIFMHGEDGAATPVLGRLLGLGQMWLVAGNLLVSVLGVWGMVRARAWSLLASFLLLVAFVLASVPFGYYALLFTPLLVAGLVDVVEHQHLASKPLLVSYAAAAVVLVFLFPPALGRSPARAIMKAVNAQGNARGDIFITEEFGHEWQYESRFIVRRFRRDLLDEAQAVICQHHCDDLGYDWKLVPIKGITLPELWVRNVQHKELQVQMGENGEGTATVMPAK